MLKTVLFFD